jgi:GxxExxY protein
MDAELRCDFFIENILVLEIKAIDILPPIHEAQILSYMRLLNVPLGLLLNFHSVNLFKEGQRTFVNEIYRDLPE